MLGRSKFLHWSIEACIVATRWLPGISQRVNLTSPELHSRLGRVDCASRCESTMPVLIKPDPPTSGPDWTGLGIRPFPPCHDEEKTGSARSPPPVGRLVRSRRRLKEKAETQIRPRDPKPEGLASPTCLTFDGVQSAWILRTYPDSLPEAGDWKAKIP